MDDLDKMGVYSIRNKINSKIYIGSTKQSFRARWTRHLYELERNEHYNKKLQNAFNKYGRDNFVFSVVEYVNNKSDIVDIEQYYIDVFFGKYCYNMNRNAGGGGLLDRDIKTYNFNILCPDGTIVENITNLSKFSRKYHLGLVSLGRLMRGMPSSNGFTIIWHNHIDQIETHQQYLRELEILREIRKIKNAYVPKRPAGRPKISENYVDKIKELYNAGYSLRAIANELGGLDHCSVRNVLKRYGIHDSSKHKKVRLKNF
jgi:hypothetical protein